MFRIIHSWNVSVNVQVFQWATVYSLFTTNVDKYLRQNEVTFVEEFYETLKILLKFPVARYKDFTYKQISRPI